MIVLIEPISNNIGMYVPAYPLPIMEIAGYIRSRDPNIEIEVISIPMDYGLPLTRHGKDHIYEKLINDISGFQPVAVGISCTAISQAKESIELCERIKKLSSDIYIFMGGYFPTVYPEEIFSRTWAVDLIVAGEGEMAAYAIIKALSNGKNPKDQPIPNLVWKKGDTIGHTKRGLGFDLRQKALIQPGLLKHPDTYDIIPYAFSRGCPFRCTFCLEDKIRPKRQEVPQKIVEKDLQNLIRWGGTRTVVVADALFRSFHLLSLFRAYGLRINFETRCDVLDPAIIPELAEVCGVLALGFESASYDTLIRMNKVRDRAHYERYIRNTKRIFKEAARCGISMMVFMIAGYPGDTLKDLEESLLFAQALSEWSGPGGHIFKIGECRVYPKTPLYDMALSMDGVVFDDDGVFGNNVVRKPSSGLDFKDVLLHMEAIFNLSNLTEALQKNLFDIMPFFRLPPEAFADGTVPAECFHDTGRSVFNVQNKSLAAFRSVTPHLIEKYRKNMSGERDTRKLVL